MKIFITSDHAGFQMKQELLPFLRERGHEVIDLGPGKFDAQDDYPDFSSLVAKEIAKTASSDQNALNESRGIIIGGSGQGEAMVANRFKGVRAIVYNGQYNPDDGREMPDEIALSREHNNANVIAIGARFINTDEAKEALEKWLGTAFSNDARHVRRLRKLDELNF